MSNVSEDLEIWIFYLDEDGCLISGLWVGAVETDSSVAEVARRVRDDSISCMLLSDILMMCCSEHMRFGGRLGYFVCAGARFHTVKNGKFRLEGNYNATIA